MNSNTYQNYAGLDVSKDSIDLCILPNSVFKTVSNDEVGHQELVDILITYPDTLVVLESTGGYERLAATTLTRQGIDVAMVNPKKIFHFAKAIGVHAKTDRQDASIIAQFAQTTTPEPNINLMEDQGKLRGLGKRREQLKKMLTAEKNRKRKETTQPAKDSIKRIIDILEHELEDIEEQIKNMINEDSVWLRKKEILTSMVGVGEMTANTLIALLPELGTTDRRHIAALVGVAPYNHDSGRKIGKRFIQGGRHDVRKSLYMAALVATKFNDPIRSVYQNLVLKGKKKKVAIIAAMRHMLIWLNIMVRDNLLWSQMEVCKRAAEIQNS